LIAAESKLAANSSLANSRGHPVVGDYVGYVAERRSYELASGIASGRDMATNERVGAY